MKRLFALCNGNTRTFESLVANKWNESLILATNNELTEKKKKISQVRDVYRGQLSGWRPLSSFNAKHPRFLHPRTIHRLCFRWSCSRKCLPVQSVRQDLLEKILHVHASPPLRKGTEIQLRPLRQKVQVQAQIAVASYLEFA